MDALKKQRGVIKGSMTKLLAYTKGNIDKANVDEIQVKLNRAQQLMTEFMVIEREIFSEDSNVESDHSDFEDNYYAVVAGLNANLRKRSLASPITPQLNNTALNISHTQSTEIRLPKITIPVFDGDYMEWQSFHDIYSATIHEKENLTASQKFQYLKSLLKGEPAALIRHLAITDGNYHEAFQKLIQRYDRKRYTVNTFIKSFMEQPSITQPTSANIRKMTDTFDEVIRGLKALGTHAETRDHWLIYIALMKVDGETRALWAQETAEIEFPTFAQLLKFLNKRIDTLETEKGFAQKAHSTRVTRSTEFRAYPTTIFPDCAVCNQGEHLIYQCEKFKNLTADQRADMIREMSRCFNCLNKNHRVYDCRSKSRCQKCHRKHHSLLHDSAFRNSAIEDDTTQSTIESIEPKENANSATSCKNTFATPATSVLPTAIVKVRDRSGNFYPFKALLDSASQASFISESCVQKLGLHRQHGRVLIRGIGESPIGQTRGTTQLWIASITNSKTILKTDALIISTIAAKQNRCIIQQEDKMSLTNFQLADPTFNENDTIDILLGVDMFAKVIQAEKYQLSSGLIAINTLLGWVIAGTSDHLHQTETANFNILIDIDRSLRRFWEIEEIPSCSDRSTEEDACEHLYKSTTTIGEDGKFNVKLPFCESDVELESTFQVAMNRLYSVEKKFNKNKEFEELYKKFMKEYAQLGHMSLVKGPASKDIYYLPHHGVLRESSSTTKLRVVFDGSAKSSNGQSLNNVLRVGPTIQDTLCEILIRFRQHQFALTGDIEKMYRQIWVMTEDRQHQNILWRNDATLPVRRYQLNTLTYGTASAPFLAIRSIQEVGIANQKIAPSAAQAIMRDFYVDDLMTGAKTQEEVLTLLKSITNLLSNHGFNLRKLLSNSKLIQTFIDSKRTLLSEDSKIFDPLGWMAPIIIRVKVLFQNLWLQDLSWDDQLPRDVLESWIIIKNELKEIDKLLIPRWLGTTHHISLHGFSDASEKAYAAVVYAITKDENNNKPVLIAAKTRVTPLKQKSLPRLELMGALLLSKLMKMIEESLNLEVIDKTLWTDSKIVLDWLSTQPRRWSTFIANRTSEILDNHPKSSWRHVPSKDNPADLASRGLHLNDLISNTLWWNGPNWLSSEDAWPPQIQIKDREELTMEEKRPAINVMLLNTENIWLDEFTERYSSYHKMNKVLAWIIRYITNLGQKMNKRYGNIVRDELNTAEDIIIKHVQSKEWSQEIKALSNGNPVSCTSKLKTLNPFIDNRGILRVGGRIQGSVAAFSVKHPIILNNHGNVPRTIIQDLHQSYNHAGIGFLVNSTRRKFWILKVKSLARFIVHKCIPCFKQNPKPETQIMGNLPEARVVYSHPFNTVGVDYCGPFKVHAVRRRGQVPSKAYVCIFICLSTKAVHIEIAMNLTTDSFIGALKRFIARRGLCSSIYSDNGTNFVGANNELQDIFKFLKQNSNEISSFLLKSKIDWHFNPPAASHMGGIWESAVKTAKVCLKRTLGETIPTLEEFSTLMIQIEAMMNSRPLCSNSSDEIDALTPAHFLIGRPLTDIPTVDITNEKPTPTARWHLIKQLQQHFWKRWYLTTLQTRQKWHCAQNNVADGDLVIVVDENVPPTRWALGKIVTTHPGQDGKVRVVSIKLGTTGSIIKRPIHKLCKLPIENSIDSN